MKALNLILLLLNRLVNALEKQQKKQEQKQHEESVDKIQDDPANWFGDHFNGRVHNDELPDNASEADKANPEQPSENRSRRDKPEQG